MRRIAWLFALSVLVTAVMAAVAPRGSLRRAGVVLPEARAVQDTAVVDQLRRSVQHSTGNRYSCTVMDNAAIKCWGINNNGQLGVGDDDIRGNDLAQMGDFLPEVDLGFGRSARYVGVGVRHTCAILDDGQITCWGRCASAACGYDNPSGDVGDDPSELGDALPRVALAPGDVPVQVEVGLDFTCARMSSGVVRCWGKNNLGQCGIGTNRTVGDDAGEMGAGLLPVDLGTGRTATWIALGESHACALLDDATLKCWGRNTDGTLGQGDARTRGDQANELGDLLPPIDLGTGRQVVAFDVGESHGCAVLDGGDVKCWGLNDDGQLGQGDTTTRGDDPDELGDTLAPVDLGAGRTAIGVTVAESHTCALLDGGDVRCWGENSFGRLGTGDSEPYGAAPGTLGDAIPLVRLGPGLRAEDIQAGYDHTCARLSDDRLKCWGLNSSGELGVGDITARGRNPDELGPRLRRVLLSGDPFNLPDSGRAPADTSPPPGDDTDPAPVDDTDPAPVDDTDPAPVDTDLPGETGQTPPGDTGGFPWDSFSFPDTALPWPDTGWVPPFPDSGPPFADDTDPGGGDTGPGGGGDDTDPGGGGGDDTDPGGGGDDTDPGGGGDDTDPGGGGDDTDPGGGDDTDPGGGGDDTDPGGGGDDTDPGGGDDTDPGGDSVDSTDDTTSPPPDDTHTGAPVVDDTDAPGDDTDPIVDTDTPADDTDAADDTDPVVDSDTDAPLDSHTGSAGGDDTDPVLDDTDPVLDDTDPVPDDTDPVPDDTDPVPDDTDPTPDDTDRADDSDGRPVPIQDDGDPSACGCQQGPGGGAAALSLLIVTTLRRRRLRAP